MDRENIYLSHKSNTSATALFFYVVYTIKFIIIMAICTLILDFIGLGLEINAIIYSLIFFFFVLISMSIYGTDTGDYIELNTSKNITFMCVHKDALKSLFSCWFFPMFSAFALQVFSCGLAIYGNHIGVNISCCLIIVIAIIFIELILFWTRYTKISKKEMLSIPYDHNIIIFLKNGAKIQWKCSAVILTVMKNNDILLRDRNNAYSVTKMQIVKAEEIDFMQISEIKVKLINNKWTIL